MTHTDRDPKEAICVKAPGSSDGGNRTGKEDDMAFANGGAQGTG